MSEASNNDDIQPDISSMAEDLGLDLPDMGSGSSPSSNASTSAAGHEDAQINHNAAPQASSMDDFEADDDFDFDFDFDDDDDFTETTAPSAPIESPAPTSAAPAPAPAPSPNETMLKTETETGTAAEADDDDFDFDFDFDDDDTDLSSAPIENNISPSDTHHSQPSHAAPSSPPAPASGTENVPPSASMPEMSSSQEDNYEDDDDFDFDFDFDDDEDVTDTAAQSAPIDNPEHTSSAAPAINDDFDFNFDDDTETDFSDFETSDDLNLDMTSETDSLSDDDMDFDFSLEDDDSGFGSGGYTPEAETTSAPQEAPPPADDDKEPRYIETSAGTLDIETDNILAFLQQLEFDEFCETLQLHPHVYDRIMASDEWSKEEMEFLRSIEPLVKDAEKVAQIREQKAKEAEEEAEAAKHRMPDTTGYEGKDGSLYDPRACESLESMQQLLKDKALDPAQKTHTPYYTYA